MKRKKGFTLIELLAVIVILAIIALITVPTVIKIINNAKKGAAEDSTYGAVDAAKLYWASHATFDNENESEDVTFTCGNDGCKYNDDILDISGDKPTGGTITISNGNVTASNLVFGNFTCNLSNDIVSCGSDSIPELPEKKYTIVNDINSNGRADIGDEIQVNGENFYVILNDGTNINALAKYNLNVGKTCTSSNSCTPIENPTGKQDASMTGYYNSTYGHGSVTFSNTNGWPYANNADIDIQSYDGPVKTAINNYKAVVTNASDVRLITKSEIETLINDGATLSTASIKDKADAKGYSWIYSTTYWVGSARSGLAAYVWSVFSNSTFDYYDFSFDNYFGVRPVITIAA